MEKEVKVEKQTTTAVHETGTIFTTIEVTETTYDKETKQVIEETKFYKMALGKDIVTARTFESKESAQLFLDCLPWDMIVNTMCIIIENYTKIKEDEKVK